MPSTMNSTSPTIPRAFSPTWFGKHCKRGPYFAYESKQLADMYESIEQLNELNAAEVSLRSAQGAVVQIITIIVTPCPNTDLRNQCVEDKIELKVTLRSLARKAIPFSYMACMLHDIINEADVSYGVQTWTNRHMTTQWKPLAEEALKAITRQYHHVSCTSQHVICHILGCGHHLNHIFAASESESESDSD